MSLFNQNNGPISYRKKGGPIDYRWEKYIEYRRRLDKDKDDQLDKEADRAQKKLLADLQALDKETLLLLRTIFS